MKAIISKGYKKAMIIVAGIFLLSGLFIVFKNNANADGCGYTEIGVQCTNSFSAGTHQYYVKHSDNVWNIPELAYLNGEYRTCQIVAFQYRQVLQCNHCMEYKCKYKTDYHHMNCGAPVQVGEWDD